MPEREYDLCRVFVAVRLPNYDGITSEADRSHKRFLSFLLSPPPSAHSPRFIAIGELRAAVDEARKTGITSEARQELGVAMNLIAACDLKNALGHLHDHATPSATNSDDDDYDGDHGERGEFGGSNKGGSNLAGGSAVQDDQAAATEEEATEVAAAAEEAAVVEAAEEARAAAGRVLAGGEEFEGTDMEGKDDTGDGTLNHADAAAAAIVAAVITAATATVAATAAASAATAEEGMAEKDVAAKDDDENRHIHTDANDSEDEGDDDAGVFHVAHANRPKGLSVGNTVALDKALAQAQELQVKTLDVHALVAQAASLRAVR